MSPCHRQVDMMNFSRRYFAFVLIPLLAACAHAPQQLADSTPTPHKANLDQIVETPKPALPNVALTDGMLYEFLLGDIAAQRKQPKLAAQAYLDLAKTSRDPRVARRAAQLAYESRDYATAVEAFKLWGELEPASPLAKQLYLSLLLSGGKLQEARPLLEAVLQADPAGAGHTFMTTYPLVAHGSQDKSAILAWMIEVTHPYPDVAEGHWAVAQAAAAAGKQDLALAEIHRAVTLRPDWDVAAVLEAQLYMSSEPQKGLGLMKKFLDAHPENNDLRLYYARALLNQKQFGAARDEFQHLLKDRPGSPDLAFAVALISMQMGEYDRAEKELHQALDNGGKDESTVHYYLAQLNEARKDDAAALEHYRQVTDGEYGYAARLREVALLDKAGKLDDARAALQRVEASNDEQRVQLIMINAQLLREDKKYEASYQVLAQGLKKFPEDTDLLYQTAMAADKLDKLELFEKLIRKLMKISPDNAHAYNALGYSLLDRKVRIPEAMKLVEKAYQLAPDDAAITDSMGWGYYLTGNLDKSLQFLSRAFAANPDPEIAAHLGEVMWKHGDQAGARKIWTDNAKANPDSEALKAVMKRFIP